MTFQMNPTHRITRKILSSILLLAFLTYQPSTAFQPSPTTTAIPNTRPSIPNHQNPKPSLATILTTATTLQMVAIGKNYTPKWKKLKTLSDESPTGSPPPPSEIGLTGTVPVIFQMGNETKTTMASVGQPLVDVASQAGQYIKYGCGKGECGTCECLSNGKFIRPCIAVVPADYDMDGSGTYTIAVKAVKNKARSSGKFYSVRSFLMGFYNNVLGMASMVLTRRAAKKNYNERMDYEDMVKAKVAEKKRLAALGAEGGGGVRGEEDRAVIEREIGDTIFSEYEEKTRLKTKN